MRLRPLTDGNDILKYADDTYLIVPAENSISCQAELTNISQWATDNNLRLNPDKTREIILYARMVIVVLKFNLLMLCRTLNV